MGDLEIVIKALRDAAWVAVRSSDHITSEIGSHLETVADNIEEAAKAAHFMEVHAYAPVALGCPPGCTSPFCDCPGTR